MLCFFGATDNNGLEKELSSRTQNRNRCGGYCIVIEEMLLISAVVIAERRLVHWKERENRCRTQRNHSTRKTS